MSKISELQRVLGVKPDGVWGPKSQASLNSRIEQAPASGETIRKLQALLGVKPDGVWGRKSQTALNRVLGGNEGTWFSCEASSFADPADLRAFARCKATGKTDLACFAAGDNGIGQFGKLTAQDHTPMVAIHKSDMIRRWGSVAGAAHRGVFVKVNGTIISATVEDRISAPGRIDLNPACAKQLGIAPPFVTPCLWRWA